MAATQISPDVLDVIIEALRDDRDALLRCSLVSRIFTAPAQRQLFSKILLEGVYSQGPDKRLPCQRLYEVLQTNQRLISYIRTLLIVESGWGYDALYPLLHMIADHGALQAFSFKFCDLSFTWADFTNAFKESFIRLLQSPHLHAIQLDDVCTGDFPIDLFAMTPQLKQLGYFYPYHPSRSSYKMPETSTPSGLVLRDTDVQHLDSLEIGGPASERLVRFLADPTTPLSLSRLRTLFLHGADCEFLHAVWEVMNLAAGSIENISWSDPELPGAAGSPHPPSQSALQIEQLDLKVLQFVRKMTIWFEPDVDRNVLAIFHICGMPPNMEELTFIILPPDWNPSPRDLFELYKSVDREFMRVLNSREYPQLRSITAFLLLDSTSGPTFDSVKEHPVKDTFPLLSSTGKFRCKVVEEVDYDVLLWELSHNGQFY